MKFFLDENFPKCSASYLEKEGHNVIDIRGTELEGSSDEIIFEKAQENQSILLTTDKDFFHTIPHLYKEHCGVIIFNLSQPNRNNILEKLKWVLGTINLNNFHSNLLLLRDNHFTHIKKDEDTCE